MKVVIYFDNEIINAHCVDVVVQILLWFKKLKPSFINFYFLFFPESLNIISDKGKEKSN